MFGATPLTPSSGGSSGGVQTQPFKGALLSGQTSSVSMYGVSIVSWGTVLYDRGGWTDPSHPTRLTVPEGVSLVRISFSGTNMGGGNWIYRNSATLNGTWVSDTGGWRSGVSAIVPATPGDFYELKSDGGPYPNPGSWLQIEAVEQTAFSVVNATATALPRLVRLDRVGLGTQNIANNTTQSITWGRVALNTTGIASSEFLDPLAPSRFIVPAGFTHARIRAHVNHSYYGAYESGWFQRVVGEPLAASGYEESNLWTGQRNYQLPALAVAAGDEFELRFYTQAGNADIGGNDANWMEVELW